jgi:hypothetical protein
LPTFADRGCHVVSVTDPYGCCEKRKKEKKKKERRKEKQ